MQNSNKPLLRLRANRESKGYTQEYMAEMLGICQSTYAHLESGKVNMGIGRLLRIADILEINVLELLEDGSGQVTQNSNSSPISRSSAAETVSHPVYERLIGELLNEIEFLRSLVRQQMQL